MTWIIALLRTSRTAQLAALAAAIILALGIWLLAHDRNVRKAERAQIEQQARQRSEKAATAANEKQEKRDEAFERSQGDLANATSPDEYLRRLREQQCRANLAACR